MLVRYSGLGQWKISGREASVIKHKSGIFVLPEINEFEMDSGGIAKVEFLLPCLENIKFAARPEEYVDKDEAEFWLFTDEISAFPGLRPVSFIWECSFDDVYVEKNNLSEKEEKTYLNIIGALLEYIKGDISGVKQHPSFSSQAYLIEVIVAEYKASNIKSNAGLSKRTLESKLAKAKASISGNDEK